jgi:hypothetical protein
LIDLNQSVGTFMSGFGSIADEVDGYGICYKAYHAIIFNPNLVDIINPGQITVGPVGIGGGGTIGGD